MQIITSDEESVAGEDGSVVTILEEVADAVLRVAWRVESGDFDAAYRKGRIVCWRGGHLRTILAANDRQWELFELSARSVYDLIGVQRGRFGDELSLHSRQRDPNGYQAVSSFSNPMDPTDAIIGRRRLTDGC
jgi:hypothetical protein